jgi:hypothetical protein
MSAVSIHQMADRVAALLEQRLGIRGTGLAAKLPKARRRLPRKVFNAAEGLAQAAEWAQSPKLLMQINHDAVANAYDTCLKHLNTLKPRSRLESLLGFAASVAVAVLAAVLLALAVLRWRGFI